MGLNICQTKQFVRMQPKKTVSCLCGAVALCTIKIGNFRITRAEAYWSTKKLKRKIENEKLKNENKNEKSKPKNEKLKIKN